MTKLRALIIDDEAAARRRITRFSVDIPEIEIIGECEDGLQAVAFIREHAPDLLFLDIHMPRMNGFAVILEVGAAHVPAVIFVTAYDESALRAFEVNAVNYLLKPFDRERFRQSVERAAAQLTAEQQDGSSRTERLQAMCRELTVEAEYKKRLRLKTAGRP